MNTDASLGGLPLFSGISSSDIERLEAAALKRVYKKNTIVLSKGDETDSLYVIREGKVKVVILNDLGKELILSTHGPNDFFGEMSLIDSGPRSASIVTIEPTILFVLHKNTIDALLSDNPVFMRNFITILLMKLRAATDKIETFAFLDVYGRVARLITGLSVPNGNGAIIPFRLTHQTIANMVGASREMVTKILKELVSGGFLKIKGQRILVVKKLPDAF